MRRSSVDRKTFDERPAEKRNMNLFHAIQVGDDEAINSGDIFLSDEELKVFVDAFTRSGFTGGINWYRNFTRNWEKTADVKQHVDAPALMIMAARDVALPPAAAEGIEKYVPNVTKYLVEDSGHWTQQEQPEEVNEVMIEWLSRRFWK
jgi:pimeloyl-ACP methyl ester carboxylesterase